MDVASIGTSIPARAMIAPVNSYQEQEPEAVRWTIPCASRSTAAIIAAGEIGGEGGLEPLIGHHTQRALLACAPDHPLDEVASLAGTSLHAVEAGGADDERLLRVR